MATGTVKWFNDAKGYGFIAADDGRELFVHFREIRMAGHKSLSPGQRVLFDAVDGAKGLAAANVRPA